jgi:hypothetical protein
MNRFIALLLALALAAVSCSGDDTSGEAPRDPALPDGVDGLINLEVIDGEPTGGAQTVEFARGDQLRIELTGNSDEQVHVHAYDFYIDPVDGEGVLDFTALIPGTFEIELEDAGRLLVRMTVS